MISRWPFWALLMLLLLPAAMLPAQGQGRLEGLVLDSLTQEPIEFATIVAFTHPDSVAGGAFTDEDGKFSIGQLPWGKYTIRIAVVGFEARDFGPYLLARNQPAPPALQFSINTQLAIDAVEITSTQDYTQNKIDRKVYAVERNLVTQGGSAAELLNTIPSVEVDIDGQLSLRGNANVTVFIDGKPSTLTGASRAAILDQLPASTIKSIEVITHPSAKYDPDGTAGIINIVTKKEAREGMNGNITLGIGTHNKYNGAASLNFRRKWFNAYGNYSFRYEERWNEGTAEVFTLGDTVSPWQFQVSDGERSSREHVLKAGIDFFLGPKTTLGLAGGYNHSRRVGDELSDFIEANAAQQALERYLRVTSEIEPTSNVEGEINLQHRPAKEGRQFDVRFALARNQEEDSELYRTDSLDLLGQPSGAFGPDQSGRTPQTFVLGTAQLDYTHTFGKTRMETGFKSTLRDIQSEYIFETRQQPNDSYVRDTNISNAFHYQEQVHAAYLILGRSFGKLSGEAGLRAEQALTGFTLFNTDSTYDNNYFNLFPSAHLAYQQSESHEWRLGYSRRINRPETESLNPFTEYSNPKRLRRGNPTLQPEYIHALELAHLWHFKAGSLSSTLYYRRLTNTVSRVIQPLGGDTLETTFINLLSGNSFGLELIGQLRPVKWLDLTISSNLFRTVMDASNVTPDLNLVNLGVDGRVLASATLSRRWSLQYTFNYQPPRQGPQGRIGARYSMDAAAKHSFMKGKANLSLRVSDIMNTMAFNIYTEDEGLLSEFYRKRESRVAYLTFGYRFGQEDKAQRKQRREERENGEGSGSGFDF